MFIYENFAHSFILIGQYDQNFENHFLKDPSEEEELAGELSSSSL